MGIVCNNSVAVKSSVEGVLVVKGILEQGAVKPGVYWAKDVISVKKVEAYLNKAGTLDVTLIEIPYASGSLLDIESGEL